VADGSAEGKDTRHIQHFIFTRELAEVYLLLDYLSGRSDRGLVELDKEGLISGICNIGWPPKGDDVEQAKQAATLLMARDRLNSQAKPANGASIAFTLLVAGDRTGGGRSFWHFSKHLHSHKSEDDAGASPGSSAGGSFAAVVPGKWDQGPPSRTSLARLAFPGLSHLADRFNIFLWVLLLGLFAWLLVTCFLSWDVAAGQAMLRSLDGLKTERTALAARLTDYEAAEEKRAADAGNSGVRPNTTETQGVTSVAAPQPVQNTPPTTLQATQKVAEQLREPTVDFCNRPELLERVKLSSGELTVRFHDATERALCTDWLQNRTQTGTIRQNLVVWLDCPWKRSTCFSPTLSIVLRSFLPTVSPSVTANSDRDEQWAVVLLGVLGASVLPFCYGVLGAGAAVVRNLWGKMRDSVLSPRDLTLSLGQLALGAVIGACIGLFVNSSTAGPDGGNGLMGSVPLTAAALSFIAGFGVEGVFVALEGLMKRVFNIPNPTP
jgi:hypothetical protein